MRYIARGREFKGVTRLLRARRQRVHERLELPFLYGPIWQGNRWRDPASLFEPVLNPNLIRHEHYFVGLIPNRDQLNAKRLPIERERLQSQRLREGSDVTLSISYHTIGIDFDRVRHFAADGICLIHNPNARMPNLFERVAHNSVAGVNQTRIFPAQHDSDLGGERLLGAVDTTDVGDPHSGRDFGWAGVGVWPINQRRHFRTARRLNRPQKGANEQRRTESLTHWYDRDSFSRFAPLPELLADCIALRDLNGQST